MPTVVDYVIITSIATSGHTQLGGSLRYQFELPSTAPRHPAVLNLQIRPGLPVPGFPPTFVAEVNGVKVYEEEFKQNPNPGNPERFRTITVVLESKSPAILRTGLNALDLKTFGYPGGMTVTDIVLWFKHEA